MTELNKVESAAFLVVSDASRACDLLDNYIDTELEVAEAELSELTAKREYLKAKIADLSAAKVSVGSVRKRTENNANAALQGALERLEVTDDPANYAVEISKEGTVSLVTAKDQ